MEVQQVQKVVGEPAQNGDPVEPTARCSDGPTILQEPSKGEGNGVPESPLAKSLLLSEIFPPRTGGSGRWFWEIYRRLPRDKVVVAAGEYVRQQEFDQTHDLHLERVPLTFRQWGIRSFDGMRCYGKALQRLQRLVRSEHIKAVHAGRNLPEGLMALALKCWNGIPYLCYVHGEEISTVSASRELTLLTRAVLRGATFLIANSKNTAALLKENWRLPDERIRMLHPGVDTERFLPAAGSPAVRQALGWGQRRVVLTVGRLQPRKGHDQMILALPAIRQSIPDVLYAIVGDGDIRPALQALVARTGMEGHVQFLGEVDDDQLVACYQQCDLFALPNRQFGKDIEGFGMVLLEAQACGKPVLAGASGGTAETMRIPETGRVVPCDGPHELASIVAALLANVDERERMGKAGRKWVVEHFDWSALTRQAAGVFKQLTLAGHHQDSAGSSRAST